MRTDQRHAEPVIDGWYGGPMVLEECRFETGRLVVDDWSRLLTGDLAESVRDAFVASLLTQSVTRGLPPSWQGPYDKDRASRWFVERQSESTVLLAMERPNGRPVGLLILSESARSDSSSDIRLGYLIHEDVWGQGLATEVVAGLTGWCRTNGTVRSIIGGVADGNTASARVLQKNGFRPRVGDSEEVEYSLTISP